MYRVTASAFTKAIRKGKASQGSTGWMVDLHSKREYKGMRCFLTPDGKTGVAIKRDGDVVSVFSTSGKKQAMAKIIPFAIANGGRKLDCYAFSNGKSLHNLYGRFGAVAHGAITFDPQYNKTYQETKRKNPGLRTPSHVVAMSLPTSLKSMARRYKSEVNIDLSRVRNYDSYGENSYDRMCDERDAHLALSGKAKGIRGALGGGA